MSDLKDIMAKCEAGVTLTDDERRQVSAAVEAAHKAFGILANAIQSLVTKVMENPDFKEALRAVGATDTTEEARQLTTDD